MPLNKSKIIVILGPTATGKTKLGVKLAQKFNGEIISADSRQVYRGMDVGTGKDLKDFEYKKTKIKYHLIDVVSPKTEFSLAKYQKLAYIAIDDILARGKLPIIVGGSGLYLEAIVDGYKLSEKKPDKILREKLEKKSVDALFKALQKINPDLAKNLNNSEKNNKRRLIRYLEITTQQENKKTIRYTPLLIGIKTDKENIDKKIYQRLIQRLEKEKMVKEIKDLHCEKKVSWKRLESFGLEYKYISLFLKNKLGYEEMVEKLFIAIRQFAKRQRTWFRRWERQGAKINWVDDFREAKKLIKSFLA